jgi:hypothetical protein
MIPMEWLGEQIRRRRHVAQIRATRQGQLGGGEHENADRGGAYNLPQSLDAPPMTMLHDPISRFTGLLPDP